MIKKTILISASFLVFFSFASQIKSVSAQTNTLVTSGVTYNSDSSANISRGNNSSVRVPQNLINPVQSWVAIRVKMGFANNTTLSPDPVMWDMSESDPRDLFVYYDVGSDTFRLARNSKVGGVSLASSSQSFSSGTTKTIIAAWTATTLKISIDGRPFVAASSSSIPTQQGFYIGSTVIQGAGRQPNSDYYWVAAGTGTLTDADAATINNFGNTDRPRSSFPGNASFIWKANSNSYNDDANSTITLTSTNSPSITNNTTTGLRIDTGASAPYTDTFGNVWVPDTGATGGSTVNRGAISISNTNDSQIYQTERYGMNSYNFNVDPGNYQVKLHFAETSPSITGPGQRVFDMDIEGREILDLDILREAGGKNTALVKTIDNVEVTDGQLNIVFTPNVQSTLINGIEILPLTSNSNADGNGDGKVDGVDFVIWMTNYGRNISGANNGDYNGDGKVDGIDYVVWLGDYGNDVSNPTINILSPVDGSTVPSSFPVSFSTNWF